MTGKAQAYQIQSKWFRWLLFPSALAIGALAILLPLGIGIEDSRAMAVRHVPVCPSKEEAARVIPGRFENLDLILYVVAALLVAGTLEIRAFYLWGEAYLFPTEGNSCVDAARFVSTVAGEFFSFMLAFIYLPAAYLLWRSINGSGIRATEVESGKQLGGFFGPGVGNPCPHHSRGALRRLPNGRLVTHLSA